MKILLCFGTRPEAIKMAPVIHELKNQKLDFKVCVTAQHREMLDQVLEFFDIIPDYDLDLMQPEQNLNSLSALILKEIDKVLSQFEPEFVLVQGDTTTAFAASFAAFNRAIKIGHIEAGLRTGNLKSPFPEEGNRQLISRITNYHFTPTPASRNNLLREGISENKIIITGNTVIDALVIGKSRLENSYINEEIKNLQNIIHKRKKLILVTGHRRENFGDGLKEVCLALLKIAERESIQIIFPVHLNPVVKNTVSKILDHHPRIHLISPVNYPAFIWLMMKASLIISDSGGIQEEAPTLKKPVIVTRELTERPEGVEAGFNILAGVNRQKIIRETYKSLDNPTDYFKKENPFGDGLASKRIVEFLSNNAE